MKWIYIFFSSLLCVVLVQSDDPQGKAIALPPDIQKYYNESGLENTKDYYMEMFKKKCEKNGHPEAYDQTQTAFILFVSCMGSLLDIDVLQEEIEDAKPVGKVDEVFKKYCNMAPEFKTCIREFTDAAKPCFTVEEQKNFKTVNNVTDQVLEFVCYKDGDRIALFIAEGGPECFQSQTENVKNCFNQTFDKQTQDHLQNLTMDDFLNLEFKEKQCDQMNSLQTCVVGVLEKCTKPTTANIIESLFNFIRKSTPCKMFKASVDAKGKNGNTVQKKNSPGAANGLTITSGALFMALAFFVLV